MCSFLAPNDGRKNRPKHVEGLTEINKFRNVASCLLYSENIYFIAQNNSLRNIYRFDEKTDLKIVHLSNQIKSNRAGQTRLVIK